MSGALYSALHWGTESANELVMAVPLQDVVTDRVARAGSEWVQGASGTEDAWITGWDYTLTVRQRYIPDRLSSSTSDTFFAGSRSWQEFLDWARDKQSFRFIPDRDYPDFYIPDCYLVEPLRGGGVPSSSGQDRDIEITIRNATYDFALALRGLMVEYRAGGATAGVWTYTRAGTALYHGPTGVATAAVDTVRDRHFWGDERVTLIEREGENVVLHSQQFDDADWTVAQATISANAATAPDGTTTADHLIEDATAATSHRLQQDIVIGAGNDVVWSVYAFAGTRSWLRLALDATVGGSAQTAWFDLATGALGSTSGANVVYSAIEPVRGYTGWYRCILCASIGGAFGTMRCHAALATQDAEIAYDGDGAGYLVLWQAQAEVAVTSVSSPILTTTAAASRVAHAGFTRAFVWRPQPLWIYLRYVETGTLHLGAAKNLALIGGPGSSSNPRLRVFLGSSGSYTVTYDDGITLRSAALALAPAIGQVVELLVRVGASGLEMRGSVAEGGESSASDAASTFPLAWSAASVSLGGTPSGGSADVAAIEVLTIGARVAEVTTIAQARST